MKFRAEFNAIRRIPKKKWYWSNELNEIEKIYFRELAATASILDIGSGSNALKDKFLRAGYRGIYHTLDLSREFQHEYYRLEDVQDRYNGIVLLEVIEHLALNEFWKLLEFVETHLTSPGKVVLSTPHARSIVPVGSWDMTHVQQYPLHDLYTLFRSRGFTVRCYRILCQDRNLGLLKRIRTLVKRVLCFFLGVDYVDGVALIITRENTVP